MRYFIHKTGEQEILTSYFDYKYDAELYLIKLRNKFPSVKFSIGMFCNDKYYFNI